MNKLAVKRKRLSGRISATGLPSISARQQELANSMPAHRHNTFSELDLESCTFHNIRQFRPPYAELQLLHATHQAPLSTSAIANTSTPEGRPQDWDIVKSTTAQIYFMLRKSIVASVLGIMIVLALPMLITALNTTSVANAASSNVTFSITAANSLTVSVSSSNIVLPVTPDGNGVFTSTDSNNNNLVVNVGTNNSTGYTLSMMATRTELMRNTKLAATDEYPKIETLSSSTTDTTPASFTLNKWGYQLKSVTGTYSTASVDTTKYLGVSPIQTLSTSTQNGDGTATLNFATKLDNTIPSGMYTTTLNFIAIANYIPSTCNPNTICYNGNGADIATGMADQTAATNATPTLYSNNFKREGYGFAGWNTAQDGTGTTFGPNQTVTIDGTTLNTASEGLVLYAKWVPTSGYLQDFTSAKCSALTATSYNNGTITPGDVIALTDIRDNNVYTIARLSDGACWMIENLRLDNSVVLDDENTNNPHLPLTNSINQSTGAIISSSDSLSATSSDWCTVADGSSDDAYRNCDNQSMLNATNITNVLTNATNSTENYGYGNYYNWYSATTGYGTYDTQFTEGETNYDPATNSTTMPGDICPSNWKLPIGGNTETVGSYSKLSRTLGNTSGGYQSGDVGTTLVKNFSTYPNNFIFSGHWNDTQAGGRSSGGNYWTATANSTQRAYDLLFYSTSIYPGTHNGSKHVGRSVRCVFVPQM